MTCELAWAAGLFDGEGTTTVCGGVPRVAVKMVDEESVRRFADAVRAGVVLGPYVHEGKDGCARKPTFYWYAMRADAKHVIDSLAPWLGAKKLAQATRIFDAIHVETSVA